MHLVNSNIWLVRFVFFCIKPQNAHHATDADFFLQLNSFNIVSEHGKEFYRFKICEFLRIILSISMVLLTKMKIFFYREEKNMYGKNKMWNKKKYVNEMCA